MLKLVSKPEIIQSAFATQGVTLNREEISNVLDTSDNTKTETIITEKPKTLSKKIRSRKIKITSNIVIISTQLPHV